MHYDGWSHVYDEWMDSDHPDIHPVGWCEATGHPLKVPPQDCKIQQPHGNSSTIIHSPIHYTAFLQHVFSCPFFLVHTRRFLHWHLNVTYLSGITFHFPKCFTRNTIVRLHTSDNSGNQDHTHLYEWRFQGLEILMKLLQRKKCISPNIRSLCL